MTDDLTIPSAATDETLLAAFVNGDRTAFAPLVKRYERELFQFIYRFLGNAAAADDVFQETFIQVYTSAKTFDLTKRFRPWLFTIAANKARDQLRSRARRQTVPLQANIGATLSGGSTGEGREFIDLLESPDVGPIEQLQDKELSERVNAAIQRLPDKLREVLILAYFNKFPYRDIAEMLNLPLGTVKSRLHAALEAFGQIWKSKNWRTSAS